MKLQKNTLSKFFFINVSILVLFIIPNIYADNPLNEILVGRVKPGAVDMAGFSLLKDGRITIKGKGATFGQWEDEAAFYGWIVNTETRKVVWHLRDEREFSEDNGIFDFKIDINLPKGNYEVYYSGSVRNFIQIKEWGDFWNNLFGGSKYKASFRKNLYMTVEGNPSIFVKSDPQNLVDKRIENAIVSFIRVGDSEDFEKSFTIKNDVKVHIYAIGEGRKGSMYDYGWIYDNRKHERIWTMDFRGSDHAGGARKNLVADEDLVLSAGSYTVRYTSDDSHSFDEWNELPPDDPQFWGITVWTADKSELSYVVPLKAADKVKPIVDITRVGDDEFLSQGFALKEDTEIHIFCLGEGTGSIMADYGWITDADTKEIVWKMSYRKTRHAGGADKNRLFDETIKLKKGKYIAFYSTDDSHSYSDWNSAKPIEAEKWGLTIWAANNEQASKIETFNARNYKSSNALAEIIRVRDDQNLSAKFELSKDSKIRIIAIGEGDNSDMFDYGWIEDSRGRTVWEMRYRRTEHAGGAEKNRYFNDTIRLDKGTYYVYYKSDDSHSYNRWNSSPPDNPELYGITILLEN